MTVPAPAGEPLFEADTQEYGRFRLVHVSPGRCRLLVTVGKGKALSREIDVAVGDEATVTIRVPR